MVWVGCGSNESQSILKYTLLQERNSPGIGLRLDIGRPVLCRAQTHSVYLFHITADACRYKTDCFDLFSLNVNHDFDKLDIKTLFLFQKFLSD